MEIPVSSPTHPRMRSSIACARCRRSKIKCVNSGIQSTCKACHASGRECIYPTPVAAYNGLMKREGESSEKTEAKKQRTRKSESNLGDKGSGTAPSVSKRSELSALHALDPTILTQSVWHEVFELFQLHFSTDLPFLHGPTFLNPLSKAACSLSTMTASASEPQEAIDDLPGNKMLLLGILALAARFHPRLVAHHSSSSESHSTDPVAASEYYARALRALLVGEMGVYIGQPNLEKVQALLMLGLHEWGICKGIKAWIHVGLAIRMAQAMGLQFEDGLDDEPWALSSATRMEAHHLGVRTEREYPLDPASSEAFVNEEIRRRTFWSCFIMDRYLSSGKYRPTMLTTEDIRIQLPSSDNAFAFGERVCTSLITGDCSGGEARVRGMTRVYSNVRRRDSLEANGKSISNQDTVGHFSRKKLDLGGDVKIACEVGTDESVLSRFIRIVEIWGKTAKWSCSGGRRTEKYPPWHPQSKFHRLKQFLVHFNDTIPRSLRLTQPNIQAHLSQRTSSAFTLLHTLYNLCLIILHREYVPFTPIRCERPEGPLDDPTFPPEQNDIPEGFWADSARQLFKAARDIMDLVQACQARGMLVETPILGFGLYTTAFVGIYAINFPQMDIEDRMCGGDDGFSHLATGQQATRKALETIGQMRPRLPMASNWFRTIHRVHRYYEKIIVDFKRNAQALREVSAADNVKFQNMLKHLSLREGGTGGGLREYKLLEKTLKEFGTIEDEDVESVGGDRDRNIYRLSVQGSNLEEMPPRVQGRPQENWTAINNRVSIEAEMSRSKLKTDSTSSNSSRDFEPPGPPPTSQQHPSFSVQTHPQSPTWLHPQHIPPSHPPPPPLTSPSSHTASTSSLQSRSPYQQPEYPPDSLQPQQQRHLQSLPDPNYAASSSSKTYTSLPMHPASTTASASASSTASPLPLVPEYNIAAHELWLDSLKTHLGGDDVAAFLDGRDWEEWFPASAGQRAGGLAEGWLSEVWGGGGRVG